jgi:phenylalanyl-tRNA synthetase beta chain
MKFTLAWLKDHLDTTATLAEIAATLDTIGLEVEEIQNPAEKLSAFVIARVLDAKQHPQADRLRVCQVEIAPGQQVEVVCGAPNARTGLVGVFAPLGTTIPGSGLVLEKKPVRGVVSNGMLCSEAELELSGESDGIIDLPASMAAHIGKRYVDVMGLDDATLHIKITPNRPDALGVRGVARDLAAAGLGTLKPEPKGFIGKGAFKSQVPIALEFSKETADACPCFAGRYIKGVKNGPSPAWLQQRLRAIGLRPINTLVDITNYITFDRGRPLHVYDADKLTGTIRARLAKSGETFKALDNKEYTATDGNCVIADDARVLGFGGIMGGAYSGSSDTTVNVLIESAYFDPVRTGHTGRKHGILSDARYRFERGIDPKSCISGADLATQMILDMCGGEASELVVAGAEPDPKLTIDFDTARIEKLTALKVEPDRARAILETLGFAVEGNGATFKATAPSWRPDVHGSADLVEEVMRIVGIDKVPVVSLPRLHSVARAVLTEGQMRVRRSRRALAARGLVEAITWSFVARPQAALFGGGQDALELANPISSELTSMRPSLLPGLLTAIQRNRDRGLSDAALFEVGQTYRGDAEGDQIMAAAGVRAGLAQPGGLGRHWDGKAQDAGIFDVKSDAAAVLATAGLDASKAQITRDAPAWFHPGRSGTFRLGPKTVLAYFGELHPDVLAQLNVDAPAAAFEVFLPAIPSTRKKASKARPPLDVVDLQPVRRDFAFVLDKAVAASDVVKAAESIDKKLVTGVTVFDVFEGGKLAEEGRKSLAIEVTLQPRDKTMTDAEIDGIAARIVAAVKKSTGGEVRG